MSNLSSDFKRIVASFYSDNKNALEKLEPVAMEDFASKLLLLINEEKTKSKNEHDLEILEYNMKLLQNYSSKLKDYSIDTDEYDFTLNDCMNIVKSTKKWLKLEGLI